MREQAIDTPPQTGLLLSTLHPTVKMRMNVPMNSAVKLATRSAMATEVVASI